QISWLPVVFKDLYNCKSRIICLNLRCTTLRSRCGSNQWLFRFLSVDIDGPVRTVLVEDDSGGRYSRCASLVAPLLRQLLVARSSGLWLCRFEFLRMLTVTASRVMMRIFFHLISFAVGNFLYLKLNPSRFSAEEVC